MFARESGVRRGGLIGFYQDVAVLNLPQVFPQRSNVSIHSSRSLLTQNDVDVADLNQFSSFHRRGQGKKDAPLLWESTVAARSMLAI